MSVNRYVFVENNVIKYSDKIGLAIISPVAGTELVIRCATSTFLQYVADTVVGTLQKIVFCDAIKRNCANGSIPATSSGATHLPQNVKIGDMPANVFSDFLQCIGSLGMTPPSLEIQSSAGVSYNCFGKRVMYILWATVNIRSSDEDLIPSAILRRELRRDWCGLATNCQCCK